MTFTAEELAILESIPAGKKQELLTFAQFLKELHEKAKNTPKKKRERPRLVGALEGEIWMSDDFNDPLEFVSPDEMKVLEAMRAAKKQALQEKELEAAV